MSHFIRAIIAACVAAPLLATACHPSSPELAPALVPARDVLTGNPQNWADAMHVLAHAPHAANPFEFADALGDTSPEVRARAAIALALIGPSARASVNSLIAATEDPDTTVRAEAAFALGAVGERSERVFRALTRRSGSRLVNRRVSNAISRFAVLPRLAISPGLDAELRTETSSAAPWDRLRLLALTSRTNSSWVSDAYVALLRDSDPEIRQAAGWGLAATGDKSSRARVALLALASDSAEWIRAEAPEMLSLLDSPGRSAPTCPHRTHDGPIQARLVIEPGSFGLRGDGRGAYVHGREGVSASHGYAFNLRLNPVGGSQPGIGPRPPQARDPAARALVIDLTRPVAESGAVPFGVVRDAGASFHFFYLWDANRALWNTRDIPIGARVPSDRAELTFELEGRWHRLQLGRWAIGQCGELYARGGAIHGNGTSPVQVERVSEWAFRVTAPAGSRGRLWDYSDPALPRDRGLYEFPFDVTVTGVPR